MRASPYDIVAYRPATNSALISASRRRMDRLLLRRRHHWIAGRLLLRPDEDGLPAGKVLGHDVHVRRLAALVELDRAAREDRVTPAVAREGVPDLLLVDGARLLDRGVEDPDRLPSGGRVPLRVVAGGLPGVEPLLHRRAGLLLVEPHRRGDVVRGRAQLVLRGLVRTARAVGDELVIQAELRVLALHGDVVRKVRVRHERVGIHVLHATQERREVLAVQVERLVEQDLEAVGRRLGAVLQALRELLAVRCVLVDDRHRERLGKLVRVLLRLDEIELGLRERLDGRQHAEGPGVVLVDRRGRPAAVHVRHLVAVGDLDLLRHERRVVPAEKQVDLVLGDELLVEVAARRGVALVVLTLQLDLDLLAADLKTARVHHLFRVELVRVLDELAGLRVRAGKGKDVADLHRVRNARGGRARRRRAGARRRRAGARRRRAAAAATAAGAGDEEAYERHRDE